MTMLIVAPGPIAAIAASRGTGIANLLTANPKEVWVDAGTGAGLTIDIDLGGVRQIDTIFLCAVRGAEATWAITGGVADYTSVGIKPAGELRVTPAVGQTPTTSHGLWHGGLVTVRYLRLSLATSGAAPLSLGALVIGAAMKPANGREWGAGRRVIDTGTATSLPSGGFAIVEGARKRAFGFTLDLLPSEVDRLEAIALDRGETRPLLVVEDPAPTAGQWGRIHYGLFERFRAWERRNPAQTRWELGIEGWV